MSTGAFITVLVLCGAVLLGLWAYTDYSTQEFERHMQQIEELRDMKACATTPTSCVEGTPYKYEA